jgi:hypothetical protein
VLTPQCARGDLRGVIEKLKSLHDGDIGVVEIIRFGERAIPLVAAILFEPEPSGLYETRRRAVEALAALKAYGMLRDYLRTSRDIADPVERTGEEAVINAAARVLGDFGDEWDLPLLFTLLKQNRFSGVIEAIGKFRLTEALPYFIDALADDFSRPAAEDAILKLGLTSQDALLRCAIRSDPISEREVDTRTQQRRSALRLLLRLRQAPHALWAAADVLIQDPDPWIAMLSSRLCLDCAVAPTNPAAITRLIGLLKSADGLLAEEIADCLLSHLDAACTMIDAAIEAEESDQNAGKPWWLKGKTLPVLLRVRAQHSTTMDNLIARKGQK